MKILRRIKVTVIINLDEIFRRNKLGKVCVGTSAENKIFGPDNLLCHSKTFFKWNKNTESSFRMSEH